MAITIAAGCSRRWRQREFDSSEPGLKAPARTPPSGLAHQPPVAHHDDLIGRHAKIRRAIVDKDVEIPAGAEIGYNVQEDKKRWFVSEEGIVVIPKRAKLDG